MKYIKSVLFSLLFIIWSILIGTFILVLIFLPFKLLQKLAILWSYGVLFLLKYIVGITYKVSGIENIPNKPFIIVSRHESSWETFAFNVIFNQYIMFVLKRQLLLIPMFGWALFRLGCIPIKRGDKNMLNKMIVSMEKVFKKNKVVAIFPEGTRSKHNSVPKCKSGIWYLYKYFKDKNISFVPVSLNSGLFWSKGQFIKNSGQIIVKITQPLSFDSSINKDEFLSDVSKIISD